MLRLRNRTVVILALAIAAAAWPAFGASEPYEPVFTVDIPVEFNPPGTVVGDYIFAADSDTRETATLRWEKYVGKYTYGEPAVIEDLTQLHFVRLAYYELLRLYYIQGRVTEADNILRKIEDWTIYSSPYVEGGKKWCRIHGYCR